MENFFFGVVERLLSSIIMGVIGLTITFSLLSGQFPPKKEVVNNTLKLTKQMFTLRKEMLTAQKSVEEVKALGQEPALEDMLYIQRINIQQTETMLKLTDLLSRVQRKDDQVKPVYFKQLVDISNDLNKINTEMEKIDQDLKKFADNRQ